MRVKNENDITIDGELQADNFSTSMDDKKLISQHVLLEDAQLDIIGQKNIALDTKLSLDGMTMVGKNIIASDSIKTDKLLFNLDDGIIKVSTSLNAIKGKVVLDGHKTIEADPQLELNLQMPLNAPQELAYKGSVTFSDAHLWGFAPIQPSDDVELDADFQNDEATINALSVNILDTNIRISGTVTNFKNPSLDINAEADELDLAKIKDLAPRIAGQYGLSFNGTGFVKVKFQGLASNPLDAKILMGASVKNASVSSSKLHQRIKNITGIIEATPNSLKWRDFTATFLDKKYYLAGSIDNFKNPKILTTINGPDLQLKADLVKNNDLITINSLTGKYLNADFDSKGTITLHAGEGTSV